MNTKALYLALGPAVLLAVQLTQPASADERVIYGDDDRRDVYATDVDPRMRELARSTALIVKRSELASDPERAGMTRLITTPYHQAYNLCPEEPFHDQPTVGFCSGFLVGPDTFVTAGHCVREASDCENLALVFGFSLDSANRDLGRVATSEVYRCREIVAQTLQAGLGSDYAVIRLDRAVAGRTPLAFRRQGAVAVGDGLTVIGHPMTLPTKIAGGRSAVRAIGATPYFVASLDTYGGNSGSAVFNSSTYEIEGILVRGEDDLVPTAAGCSVSKRCTEATCRGEDVTRISEVLPYIVPEEPDLRPTQPTTVERQGLALAIPDANATGVTLPLEVTASGPVAKVGVRVRFTHRYPADLEIALVHADGTTVVLLPANSRGIAAGEVELAFGAEGRAVAQLRSLKNKEARGTWKLVVKDVSASDVGTLKAATLKLDIYQD